jgi:hypothetical protein
MKIPVSAPDSTSLYVVNSLPLVETFIGSELVLPISSTKPLSVRSYNCDVDFVSPCVYFLIEFYCCTKGRFVHRQIPLT